MFKSVDPKMNLPSVEKKILEFWDENKIFEKSLEIRRERKKYSFYDGPPFATGTPHYGHIVASTMKDAIPRYWTMKGYYVDRVWGWDCHGLPIENIAEQDLGITRKKEIEKIGVAKFNQFCRSKVLKYVEEWKKVIRRLGRWADMNNAYKTMDLPYMESVWWVFEQLWDKGLVYEGFRSMHVCPRCETTLSQSEVTEGYKNIKDLSVIVKFRLLSDPNISMLAWTTTPWTLIANVALAVGEKIDYVKIKLKNNDEKLIIAKDQLSLIKDDYKIEDEFKGGKLVGERYQPLFDYYSKSEIKNRQNGWQVHTANFVSTDEGTGIVHIAPAFGEDDLTLAQIKNLPVVQHIGLDGVIGEEADEFAGLDVKPKEDYKATDKKIVEYLERQGNIYSESEIEHSYPHCWRCETPLLNYATLSWFVRVTEIKEEAIRLAGVINWSPKHIKEGRFGKWLEGAKDWSISRQRYWASVIPIWRCSCGETQVIGSVKELEELSGEKISDLHKDVVDKITFKCKKCQEKMRRIPDVLDTWFDSASMPYGQLHYPFENKEKFDQGFPADFIAEGADQTRAWFYYLHTIATAIFDKVAYKNVIVNGIVLAADGKKMSKRLQNYPDPMEMFEKYGADVLRYYLLSSPVMMAENLNFNESEIAELSRRVFRMLWNSYYFFTLYVAIDQWQPQKKEKVSTSLLDRWIISESNLLIENVNNSMTNYDLVKAIRLFTPFIDNLSNWYIRRSRKRFWKSENDLDKEQAYQTLYTVLVKLSQLLAPFTPFIADEIYKNLTSKESVHLSDFPEADKNQIDQDLNLKMNMVRKIVEIGLKKRAELKIKVRQPLAKLEYCGQPLHRELLAIIGEEVNVKKVELSSKSKDQIDAKIDMNITEELKMEGIAREIIRTIQELRKEADFKVNDRVIINYHTESSELSKVIDCHREMITKEVLANEIKNQKTESEYSQEKMIEGENIWFGLSRSKNV